MSKKGSPWTPEEEADLLEGLRNGKSFEMLSRIHQRSLKAVQWRWGLYCKKQIHQGKNPEHLASEFGVDTHFLKDILESLSEGNEKPIGPSNINKTSTPSYVCSCKEQLILLTEKTDRNTRLLKKCLDRQEKILEKILSPQKKSFKKESKIK